MLKQFAVTVTGTGSADGEAEMLVSNAAVDREGDRIMPEGCDAAGYLKNPVILFGHDFRSIPIGSCTGLDVSKAGIRARWKWNAEDELGGRVMRAWNGGFIRSASIGFIPKAGRPNDVGGVDISKWELLEISLVPIPANAEAVRALKSLGFAASDEQYLLVDGCAISKSDIKHLIRESIQASFAKLETTVRSRRAPNSVRVDGQDLDLAEVQQQIRRAVQAEMGRATRRATGRVD
jgi:HK97 family phage prohead protease